MRTPGNSTDWELEGETQKPDVAALGSLLELEVTAPTRKVETSVEVPTIASFGDIASMVAIDAAIVASDGGLPAQADALEARRFQELKTLFENEFDQKLELDVDDFLAQQDISTTSDFIALLRDTQNTMRLAMDIVMAPGPPNIPESFPVSLGVMSALDPLDDLQSTLTRIQSFRRQLLISGQVRSGGKGLASRSELTFLLVGESEAFDDNDLPFPSNVANPNQLSDEQKRTARIQELRRRLRPFGVVVAAL